jgi:hypothetical protein
MEDRHASGIDCSSGIGVRNQTDVAGLHGEKMKILIVDDDDALRSLLAEELEVGGYEVLQTHFGDGGLHLYQKADVQRMALLRGRRNGASLRQCLLNVSNLARSFPSPHNRFCVKAFRWGGR